MEKKFCVKKRVYVDSLGFSIGRRRVSGLLFQSLTVLLFPFVTQAKRTKTKRSIPLHDLIDEKDTLAQAMKYCHDAHSSPFRTNKEAFCYNCAKYNVCPPADGDCKPLGVGVLENEKVAPCQIFKAKKVAKKGWCLSWQPRNPNRKSLKSRSA